MEWDIKEDQLKWQKYTLQKATTTFGGRTWEAWFAPEIPISDGPYKFNGLPGLIVRIKDSQDHYIFNLRAIEKAPKNSFVEIPKDFLYIETDKKGFRNAEIHFNQDIINRAKEAKIDAPESLQKIAENRKKRNNPIELVID